MAVLENSNPKTKKTSASVTSTLPRLCPTTKLYFKDISCNNLKVKGQCLKSRRISNEDKIGSGVTDSQKSKLTEFNNSEQGFSTTISGLITSPRDYHGQIPVLSRRSLYLCRMSPPITRSPSPSRKISQKEKSTNKIKTITLEQETKKKSKPHSSRSPSPSRRPNNRNKKSNSRTSSSPVGDLKNSEKMTGIKRADSSKQASPRINSLTKRKSKAFSSSNVGYSQKGKPGKEILRSIGDSSTFIIKQTSQPSLFNNEKIIQPQEKISLDHIKNEIYSGDRRLSLEKVHLCIEQTVENYNVAERKRSYLVAYSSEDIENEEEISLTFLNNVSSTNVKTFSQDADKRKLTEEIESKSAIKTLSGHQLFLTPSMKLDMEKDENNQIKLSDILQGHGENFDDKNDIHILQDDANEYDSEMSTDGEMVGRERQESFENRKSNDLESSNSLWKSREADLLNDVDYRQSVYHPAVSRRQKPESGEKEFRPKSKSIEDNFGYPNKTSKRIVRTRSTNLNNKYVSQCFATDKMSSCSNDRSWASGFDKNDERPMYNSVMQDVPFYGMKRIRTKRERISGAFLRFTLKVIRLLAIFNMWPGDNCYMLTSQSLRFAR